MANGAAFISRWVLYLSHNIVEDFNLLEALFGYGGDIVDARKRFWKGLVAQDGDITLPELAGALEAATDVAAHAVSIGGFLRKLGNTYKKIACCDGTVARSCEEAPLKLVQTTFFCSASAIPIGLSLLTRYPSKLA